MIFSENYFSGRWRGRGDTKINSEIKSGFLSEQREKIFRGAESSENNDTCIREPYGPLGNLERPGHTMTGHGIPIMKDLTISQRKDSIWSVTDDFDNSVT